MQSSRATDLKSLDSSEWKGMTFTFANPSLRVWSNTWIQSIKGRRAQVTSRLVVEPMSAAKLDDDLKSESLSQSL